MENYYTFLLGTILGVTRFRTESNLIYSVRNESRIITEKKKLKIYRFDKQYRKLLHFLRLRVHSSDSRDH